MLAAKPSGDVHNTAVAGAQSSFPFNRKYMYTPVQAHSV
jgi:cyclopropane-fatty-acyl-phospholipid synthase